MSQQNQGSDNDRIVTNAPGRPAMVFRGAGALDGPPINAGGGRPATPILSAPPQKPPAKQK